MDRDVFSLIGVRRVLEVDAFLPLIIQGRQSSADGFYE